MAHRDFLIRYSNGFKRHVSKNDLDLLGASLTKIGPREYLCSMSIQGDLEHTAGPNFLQGQFIIQYPRRLGWHQKHERLETPKGLVERMSKAPKSKSENVFVNGEGNLQFV